MAGLQAAAPGPPGFPQGPSHTPLHAPKRHGGGYIYIYIHMYIYIYMGVWGSMPPRIVN